MLGYTRCFLEGSIGLSTKLTRGREGFRGSLPPFLAAVFARHLIHGGLATWLFIVTPIHTKMASICTKMAQIYTEMAQILTKMAPKPTNMARDRRTRSCVGMTVRWGKTCMCTSGVAIFGHWWGTEHGTKTAVGVR